MTAASRDPAATPDRGRGAVRMATAFGFAALAIGLAILLVHVARPYTAWPNLSDDFFYYLVLARESVLHGVVSADGLRPTNGFHPLYFLTLRAAYPLVGDAALPNVALAILALAHAGACVLLWLTLRRLAGALLAGLLLGLYAANPHVLRIVFAAVETPLMVLFVSLFLWAHVRWLERGDRGDRALALVALALAVASRTDVVFLAGALAFASWPRRIDPAPLIAGATPVVLFGTWGQIATGEFVQTSGRALSLWQSAHDWRLIHDALGGLGGLRTAGTAVVYALEVIGQWIAYLLRGPWEALGAHPVGWVLLGASLLALRSRGPATAAPVAPGAPRVLRELLIHQLAFWTFYALLFRHGQIWYWHGSIFVWTVIAAIALARMRERPPVAWVLRRLEGLRGATVVFLLAILAMTWISTGRVHPRERGPSAMHEDPAAPDPLRMVPDGSALAAFDTGRLGWEESRLVVVNLDGLVNNAAYRALREKRIGEYMLEQRIEWLYVKDGVVRRFQPFGLDAWLSRAQAVARSGNGVVLYRWNGAAP